MLLSQGRIPARGSGLFSCAPGMARSAVTGAVNRGAKVKREVTRRCPAREVLWGSRWQEPLAEQQPRHREVGWEGSCKQTPGPRNTKRIGGVLEVGEGAKRPEARCHPDRRGVDATGAWEESQAPYPGRSAHLPKG